MDKFKVMDRKRRQGEGETQTREAPYRAASVLFFILFFYFQGHAASHVSVAGVAIVQGFISFTVSCSV